MDFRKTSKNGFWCVTPITHLLSRKFAKCKTENGSVRHHVKDRVDAASAVHPFRCSPVYIEAVADLRRQLCN